MALENLTGSNVYISNLVPSNPTNTDPVSQGDDHLRGIKNVLLNTFPNVTGPVTATQAQLNSTTTLATTYAPLASPALTGTPTAPTAAALTNTTQLATTAFCNGAIYLNNAARTWQTVTRTEGVTYTNTSGREIFFLMEAVRNAQSVTNCNLVINGQSLPLVRGSNSGGGNYACGSLIVPINATYYWTNVGGQSLSYVNCWEYK